MKNSKDVYELVLKDTARSISDNRYKTTSFTLLRSDYDAFKLACKKARRKPSEVLRSLVSLFVQGKLD